MTLLAAFGLAGIDCNAAGKSDGEAAGPTLPRDEYQIKVEIPASITPGQEARIKVMLTPKAPYKVNVKFPFKLIITAADEAGFVKKEFKKADAKKLDVDGLRFAAPFTPQTAGPFEVKLELGLSVCVSSKCVTRKEAISVKLTGPA